MFDYAIIGAGMAGASLAAELAPHASVLLIEAEDSPGYHSTGRSAAFWEECYGGPEIVPLTLASGSYLREHGFLSPRGALYIGRDRDRAELDRFAARFAGTGATLERLDGSDLAARIPGLRDVWTGAVWEPACADIDVAGLHQHYLKAARAGGVPLEVRARLVSAQLIGGVWTLVTEHGARWQAVNLVDAAGAWADRVAHVAGLSGLGVQPYRRTVAQLRVSPVAPDDLPLCLDIAGGFYFKPDNGRIWLSPHDETPCAPCDAAPEEIDVATAIARFEEVADWAIEAVEHKWAGLRSFAPDRRPIYGRDPRNPAFAWFAGQGGYGIQTAPAAARLMAQHLLGNSADAMTSALDPALYAPERLL